MPQQTPKVDGCSVVGESLYFTNDYRKKLLDNSDWTYDIPYLNNYESHYLFVYGTLKRGCARHIALSANTKNQFCGIAMTKGDNYDLLVCDPGGFPVLFEDINKDRHAQVRGELWMVPTETLLTTDRIEQNTKVYERVFRKVFVGKQEISAYTYVGRKDFWRDKVLKDMPRYLKNAQQPYKYYHSFSEAIANRSITKVEERVG